MLTDSHTHLYLKDFEDDLNTVIENALNNKVDRFMLPNIDDTTILSLLDLHKKDPSLFFPMLGLHPCSVKKNFIQKLEKLYNYIDKYPFIGIGEIGIDLYWDNTFIEEQKEALAIQINWSKKYNLPIIIHSRNSFNEIYSIVSKEKTDNTTGIFHCFSGSYQEALKIIDMGFYLGIGGVITFKNSNLCEIIKKIDLKHLVLETDAPYLAPHPMRGKRNEPKFLTLIANKIAEIKNTSVELVAEITTQNTNHLFFNK